MSEFRRTLSEAEVAAETWHDKQAEADFAHEITSGCWCCCWCCERENPYFEEAHVALAAAMETREGRP